MVMVYLLMYKLSSMGNAFCLFCLLIYNEMPETWKHSANTSWLLSKKSMNLELYVFYEEETVKNRDMENSFMS